MIDDRALMADEEIDLLKKTIGKDKVIIEIGCYIGNTTRVIAKDNLVIAIDPFISGYDPKDPSTQDMKGVEEKFRSNIEDKNVIWLKEKSEEALKNWSMMVDGVFIDGKHSTEALTEDTKWIRYVKKNGIIAFHDYGCWQWPGVTKIIDKNIIPKHEEIGRERFLIIFRKQ